VIEAFLTALFCQPLKHYSFAIAH